MTIRRRLTRWNLVSFTGGITAVVLLTVYMPNSAPAPNYHPPHGALNPAVTQATIGTTICVPGWTATIRPPVSYTNRLKAAQMTARHLPGTAEDYELDHFIPLELGGAPRDPANLWPEARSGAHASAVGKDRDENHLKMLVCAHRLTLAAARREIADPTTWRTT